LFEDIGEESLKAFVRGIDEIGSASNSHAQLPEGFDAGVLDTCQGLGRVLDHGIDEVAYEIHHGHQPCRAVYTAQTRQRVRDLLGEPADAGVVSRAGRLARLDGHERLAGTLWEADGTSWSCRFTEEQLSVLAEAWMHTVKVTGQAVVSESGRRNLQVHSIVILDEGRAVADEWDTSPFWHSRSLTELAQEQNVRPVQDLGELECLWPEDTDPDELLRYILAERTARYRHGQKGEDAVCE